MTGSHSIKVHAVPPAARKDIVHLRLPSGARAIATGDATKGIKVPAGCTIERIELWDGGGGFLWTGEKVDTVRLDLRPGAVNYDILPD